MRDVTRRFGPVLANDRVSLELRAGEVHALVGENGAGKSTLMKVLYGLHPPEAGTIEVDGRAVTIDSPATAMKLGLGMVHQHFLLVDTLTVAENVVLGLERRPLFGSFSPVDAEHAVAELSRRYLRVDPHARVSGLSVGEQQRVEILKVLYRGARVLILDEPTAVLTPQEVDELFVVLKGMRDHGTAIVLITHKLAEVKALADRVTVMRGGRVVGGGMAADLSIEAMAELMVGRVPPPLGGRAARAPGERVLEAIGLNAVDARGLPAVVGVWLHVRAGEIVGVAGVSGNGQRELMQSLTGQRVCDSGTLRVEGRDYRATRAQNHRHAVRSLPEEPLANACVGELGVGSNMALRGFDRAPLSRTGWMRWAHVAARARELIAEYGVKTQGDRAPIRTLSGGNVQRAVLARELSSPARLLLVANPVFGLDFAAVAEIHARLMAARNAGTAVLLISEDLDELLELSDRIVVISEGRIVHETAAAAADRRTLGAHMGGRTHAHDAAAGAAAAPAVPEQAAA